MHYILGCKSRASNNIVKELTEKTGDLDILLRQIRGFVTFPTCEVA